MYVQYIMGFTAILGGLTYAFSEDATYQTSLGYLSSAVEALLGVSQFCLNYERKSTSGLS